MSEDVCDSIGRVMNWLESQLMRMQTEHTRICMDLDEVKVILSALEQYSGAPSTLSDRRLLNLLKKKQSSLLELEKAKEDMEKHAAQLSSLASSLEGAYHSLEQYPLKFYSDIDGLVMLPRS